MKVAQLPSRKRKQNIIIIILLIGLPLLLFAAYQVVQIVSKASSDIDPKNVVVSSITTDMITISWTTDSKTNGSVIPVENGKEKSEVKDVRGTGKRYTHYVELTHLEPNTKYSFKIKSDSTKYSSSEGKDLVFTTAPITTEFPTMTVGYSMRDVSDDDSIIFILLSDNSSFPVSATLKDSKTWTIDLSSLRKITDKSRISVKDSTGLKVLVRGGDGKGAILTGTYSSLFDSAGFLRESNDLVLEDGVDIYAQIPAAAKLLLKYPEDPPEPPDDPDIDVPIPDDPDVDIPIPNDGGLDVPDNPEYPDDYEFTNRQYRIVHHLQWEELVKTVGTVSKPANVGPSSVRVTNLTDTGFTVLWVSANKESGTVKFGLSPKELDQTANDQRDGMSTEGNYYVHSVKLERLRIDTMYYYQITSGEDVYDNNGKMYSTKTLPAIDTSSPYVSISGSISNVPEHGEVFLIGKAVDGDEIGSLEESYEVSTAVDEKGNWTMSIGDLRAKDGESFFEYTEGDTLVLEPFTTVSSTPQEESMDGIDQREDIAVKLSEPKPQTSSPTVVSQLSDYGVEDNPNGVVVTGTDEIPKTGILDSFVGIMVIASTISILGISIYIFSRKNSKKNGKMTKNL